MSLARVIRPFALMRRNMAVRANVKEAYDTSGTSFPAVSAAGFHRDFVGLAQSLREFYSDPQSKINLSAGDKERVYEMLDGYQRQLARVPGEEQTNSRASMVVKDHYTIGELPLFKA
mmetsp:Transcript_18201/g.37953  ORF Transcript_18201/g.37953 Transcript_18201/m.37953 type:complete len:117 (+) Transcript_18201:88-438(+)